MYCLGNKAIWYDEACSIAAALKNPGYIFGPPHTLSYKTLYFLLLKLWINAFGLSEFALRSLSVIFSVSSIYLIFRLANLLFCRRVAVMSSFLLSISAFHIFHAQQVRYQSLMVTLVLASYIFLVKFLSHPGMKYILLTSLFNFLILNTHPYGILIIIAQALFVLIYFKTITKPLAFKWIIFQAAGACAYLILFLLPSLYYLNDRTWWMPRANPVLLREFFFTLMFGGHRFGLDDYDTSLDLLVIPQMLAFIFLTILLSVIINFSRKTDNSVSKAKPGSYCVLFSWLFLPLAIAYTVSCFKPLFAIKHLIYLLPPFLILSAKGYTAVKNHILKVSLLIIAIMISAFRLPLFYSRDYNINWRQPATYIFHNLKPRESIIICTRMEIIPFMYYFDYGNKDRLKALDIYGQWSKGTWETVIKYNNAVMVGIAERRSAKPSNPFEDFTNKFAENKFSWHDNNVWVATSRWGWGDNFPLIERKLSDTHIKVFEESFGGVRVAYWRKRS